MEPGLVTAPELIAVGLLEFGSARAEPGLLKVSGPGGDRTLEPRVMAVLVELMQAGGGPVSRDTLGQRCWQGRAVSEDALNRAVAKLRRAVRAVAGEALTVETIRRVGYRLHPGQPSAAISATSDLIAPAFDLETRALGAMFEGTRDGSATAVHYLQQAVAERPRHAPTWGSLAMAYVLRLPFADDDRMLVAARAREAALKAQSLDTDEGRSLAALASLEPTFGAWDAKAARLREAHARAPAGTAPLIFQRVLLLASIGAMAEALTLVEPLAAWHPLVPWIQSARAHALAAAGRLEAALDVSGSALARWPRHRLVWFTHFHLSLSAGRAAEALALAGAAANGDLLTPQEASLAVSLAEAAAVPDGRRRQAVLQAYAAVFAGSQTLAEQAILAAAQLGADGEACGLLLRLYREDIPLDRGSIAFPKIGLVHPQERGTALMFLEPLRKVREHPSFKDVLAQIGLAPRPA